jgi:hypothetical protein
MASGGSGGRKQKVDGSWQSIGRASGWIGRRNGWTDTKEKDLISWRRRRRRLEDEWPPSFVFRGTDTNQHRHTHRIKREIKAFYVLTLPLYTCRLLLLLACLLVVSACVSSESFSFCLGQSHERNKIKGRQPCSNTKSAFNWSCCNLPGGGGAVVVVLFRSLDNKINKRPGKKQRVNSNNRASSNSRRFVGNLDSYWNRENLQQLCTHIYVYLTYSRRTKPIKQKF